MIREGTVNQYPTIPWQIPNLLERLPAKMKMETWVLRLWRKYFPTLLQSDDNSITAFRDDMTNPIEVEIPPLSHEEARSA